MVFHDRHSMPPEIQNPTRDYTLRKMYEYYHGPIYKMFSRLPSCKTKLSPKQIVRYKTIMDSMKDRELDALNPQHISVPRMKEIARGSIHDMKQVSEMLKEYKRLEKVWRNLEKFMSDTKMMNKAALFWNEIATPFHVEMVTTELEYVPPMPPRKR